MMVNGAYGMDLGMKAVLCILPQEGREWHGPESLETFLRALAGILQIFPTCVVEISHSKAIGSTKFSNK